MGIGPHFLMQDPKKFHNARSDEGKTQDLVLVTERKGTGKCSSMAGFGLFQGSFISLGC